MELTKSRLALLAIMLLSATLCVHARQQASEFLGDYSGFEQAKFGTIGKLWRNPKTDIAQYSKVMIDAVALLIDKEPEYNKWLPVKPEEFDQLALYFYDVVRRETGQQFNITDRPGPDVMRIRLVLTEVQPTDSHRYRQALGLYDVPGRRGSFKSARPDPRFYQGRVSMEGEVVDSVTGDSLLAFQDRRVGGRAVGRTFDDSKWGYVQQSLNYWAAQISGSFK